MKVLKKVLKIVGVLFVVLALLGTAVYAWAAMTSKRMLSQRFDTHVAEFPIPFPLDPAEVSAMGLTADAARQLAQKRAIERGQHLVSARYACVECHSANFGGGVMVDAFPLGRLLGPNLTLGTGSRTADFAAHDWDRIVRHGVLRDGLPAVMPSEDFQHMSDQELSDIVSYIRSLPPVDNTVPKSSFGPLGKVLIATGKLRIPASVIASHTAAHPVRPPDEAVSAEFGKHLASVCMGCHGPDFSGGKINGGDPGWPPARNLTPDATGLTGWTYDQFVTALTKSQRPDGTALRPPMTLMANYAQHMKDVERQALWAYLQSLPPVHKAIERR
jgi:mono/diheme cytochrome c family protein